ncbi:MAG: hypothetical protein QFX32_06375 [Methanolinea sp.]|nr:hypothetical protein [Methanolinea sp.]
MNLDELRVILLSERESGRLVQIPHDLFSSAQEVLARLHEELRACSDPFSEEAQVLIQRINAIRETLHDIFRIRAEKILTLALSQEDGHYVDREETKRLIPEEREMCDLVVQALATARCRLLEQAAPRPSPAAPGTPGATAVPAPAQHAAVPFVVSRVLRDVEPFMGVDGRIYDLKREDIVTLPERNAEVLCERNIVLNINPGK